MFINLHLSFGRMLLLENFYKYKDFIILILKKVIDSCYIFFIFRNQKNLIVKQLVIKAEYVAQMESSFLKGKPN